MTVEKDMIAKINEFMKANSKRELTMDELDQVTGGSYTINADGTISVNDRRPMNRAEFNNMVLSMADQLGEEVAVYYLRNTVGLDWIDKYHAPSVRAILESLWRNV